MELFSIDLLFYSPVLFVRYVLNEDVIFYVYVAN